MNAQVTDPILDELAEAIENAARLSAQEVQLEEERKILFSELVIDAAASKEKVSMTLAEHIARADLRYQEKSAELAKVRELAKQWAGKTQALQARVDVWRTRMASARAKVGNR